MKRSDCLTPLAVLALAVSGEPARAQDAALQQLERVEIVGSHLKRVDREGPAPVSTYTRDAIEASGAARLGDFLLTLPFVGAGGFDDRSTVFSTGLEGTAAVSLRGLGPGATLVLLNGRRLAAYGFVEDDGAFVDLNSLPLAAVERVEILRDGASAIYGADAIGGVVNIVLRRDFAGAEATARVGQSTRGDARRVYASASLGAGDLDADRYNAFVTIDAQRQDAVPMVARSFSRSADQRHRGGFDGRFPTSSPPTIQLPGGDPFAAHDCPPDRVVPAFIGTVHGTFCSFDPNLYNPLMTQIERVGATLPTCASTRSSRSIAWSRRSSCHRRRLSPWCRPTHRPTRSGWTRWCGGAHSTPGGGKAKRRSTFSTPWRARRVRGGAGTGTSPPA